MNDELEINAANIYFSNFEIERYNSITNEKRKKEYLYTRMACKHALEMLIPHCDYKKLEIAYGVFQQPIVTGKQKNNLQISVSNSYDYIAAFAYDGELPSGINIEKIYSGSEQIIEYFLTNHEKKLIAHEKEIIYTVFWTAKEALSKVLRAGLAVSMYLFEIERYYFDGTCYRGEYCNFPDYEFISTKADDCIYTVTVPKESAVVCEVVG